MHPISRLMDAYTAAQMYYLDGMTMEEIGAEHGCSRSTVSRMLRDARDHGLVTISLRPPGEQRVQALRAQLRSRFGITAHVVPVTVGSDGRTRLADVAREAARVIDAHLQPDSIIAVAWGTTLTAVAEHVIPRTVPGARVVQLNGAIDSEGSGFEHARGTVALMAEKWDATAHPFVVPAFFDYEETRRAVWRERSTTRIVDLQDRASLAVFSGGAFEAEVPSKVYTSGYFSQEITDQLAADGVVGDVCTRFLRPDGSWDGIAINQRASGPSPERLMRIPRRLMVASGLGKVPVIRAALLAGLVTDLVIDEAAATALLAHNVA